MSSPPPAEAEETSPVAADTGIHGHPTAGHDGQVVVHTDVAGYHDLVAALKQDGYTFCSDLCAVDYLTAPRHLPDGVAPQRFEVVASLLDMAGHRRIRVRCQVPADKPVTPTLFDLFPGADAMEREAYDLMGIVFEGHPDLTRILMPDEWEGHPLRKDYAVGRVPVQFKTPADTR
jgi:NADH-quinone oxidoreductase subunit C